MAPTVYLVSGANRGLGIGIVDALSKRENVVVFAGARDPLKATELQKLCKERSNLHVVKLISADAANNAEALKEIKEKAGRLDVVIANAAISDAYVSAVDTTKAQMNEHFDVNCTGVLFLFQACWPLLSSSTDHPKFAAITSTAGSIELGSAAPVGLTAYGCSKAACNYLIRRLFYEHTNLVAFSICPGSVETDMAVYARSIDPVVASWTFRSIEDCAGLVLDIVDKTNRDNVQNPGFVTVNGTVSGW